MVRPGIAASLAASLRAAALAGILLLALAPAPMADAPPPTPGPPANDEMPELVWVVAIEGAPADSSLRAAFDRGFKLGFEQALLRTERDARGRGFVTDLPVRNRFLQLFGTTGEGAWQFQASIEGIAAPARAGSASGTRPAADVTLIIHSPAMVESNARPLPVRWRLTSVRPPASAPDYARSLGRAVALLGLEHLHRLLEAHPEDGRLVVDDFERSRPPVGDSPVRR